LSATAQYASSSIHLSSPAEPLFRISEEGLMLVFRCTHRVVKRFKLPKNWGRIYFLNSSSRAEWWGGRPFRRRWAASWDGDAPERRVDDRHGRLAVNLFSESCSALGAADRDR
jgi:hypothetical protein